MLKFRLDPEDTFLILAPRWADLGTAWQVGLLAALLLVPLLLILWLCRYEMRLVSRPAACGFLLLRLAILVVIWVTVGVQPQVAHIHVEETPGRVRIAVDLSSSMDVADRQRTSDENAGLKRALKLADVDGLTRKQIVGRILGPQGMNLVARLADRHQVEIVGFHRHPFDMQPTQLMEALFDEKASHEVRATDLVGAVKRESSGNQPLRGILLFSDGQHNVGAPPYDRADELGKQRVPIFPVVVGSREPPHDVMILDMQTKTKVFKDTTAPIEVRCKVTNMPAQAVTVELQIDNKPVRPEHRQVIEHQGKDDVYTVRFQAKMDESGTHALSVKAISKEPKEITLANNTATRAIRVTEDKAKVLLVDGEARWEYHYLANALNRDATISLDRVVFAQPRIGAIKDADLDKAGFAKTKLPDLKPDQPTAVPKGAMEADRDPLMDYDCVFLGDVSPEQLPGADRRRLERFVAERGGTLVLMAGKRHLPKAFIDADKKGDDPLVKMLPISDVRELTKDTGFTLRLTGDGKLRSYLQLEADQSWPDLPKHFWGIVGKRKPAASVLVTPVYDNAAPNPKDEADNGIVLEHNHGFGRVLFVGLDSTWRWRYRVGDVYHHRFWGQVVRWSAAEKLLPAGNRWVRYGSRDPVYAEGENVELAARLSELLPPLKDVATARAKLHRQHAAGAETLVATVALAKHMRQPNLLEAKVPGLSPGIYRIELDIPQYQSQIAEPSEDKDAVRGGDLFRVLPREERELLDLSTNWTVMQSLAERSDGKLYTPETVEEVIDRLARHIERKEDRRESKPWQHEPMVWWMLGALLALLMLEWGWRKWLDLP